MTLSLAKTWELTYDGQTIPIPKKLVYCYDGEEFFKLCATHSGTVKLLTRSKAPGKNVSIANSPGIRALIKARNIASGILVPVVPKEDVAAKVMEGACMIEDSAEPKLKRAKPNKVPPSCLVTSQIEGYGEVVMRRAVSLDEAILVPMKEKNILALFEAILHVGIDIKKKDLGTTRSYVKSGKYAKSQPEEAHGEHDGEAEDDAEDDAEEDDGSAASGFDSLGA